MVARRPKRGTTRKETESQVEDTVPDSVTGTSGVPRFSASQIPLEGLGSLDDHCSDLKAVKSVGVINTESTQFAPLHEPVSSNVAGTSVPDLGLKGTQMGKRRPLQAVQANGATPSSSSASLTAIHCTREDRGRDVAVQQVCDAIDAEVEVRSEVIKAIASAQLRSITSQLQLQVSRLPVHVQNMPLHEYLKSCPNVVSKELDNGRIRLQKASPVAVFLKDSKKNLSDILSMARDNLSDEPGSLINTPAFHPTKPSVTQLHQFASEELSWPEYHAKLQALGHIGGYPASSGTQFQQDSAVSLKTSFLRGMTPKTVRIPKQGEVLLSLNGSPLGQFGFTPGSYVDNLASVRKGGQRVPQRKGH